MCAKYQICILVRVRYASKMIEGSSRIRRFVCSCTGPKLGRKNYLRCVVILRLMRISQADALVGLGGVHCYQLVCLAKRPDPCRPELNAAAPKATIRHGVYKGPPSEIFRPFSAMQHVPVARRLRADSEPPSSCIPPTVPQLAFPAQTETWWIVGRRAAASPDRPFTRTVAVSSSEGWDCITKHQSTVPKTKPVCMFTKPIDLPFMCSSAGFNLRRTSS